MTQTTNARDLEAKWAKPEYEVLCHVGHRDGAITVARLEHKGRSVWKSRATAERHAREYQAAHGRMAYASEC